MWRCKKAQWRRPGNIIFPRGQVDTAPKHMCFFTCQVGSQLCPLSARLSLTWRTPHTAPPMVPVPSCTPPLTILARKRPHVSEQFGSYGPRLMVKPTHSTLTPLFDTCGCLGPFQDTCRVSIGIWDRIPGYTLNAILRGLGRFM
jgi:hypothetical protein